MVKRSLVWNYYEMATSGTREAPAEDASLYVTRWSHSNELFIKGQLADTSTDHRAENSLNIMPAISWFKADNEEDYRWKTSVDLSVFLIRRYSIIFYVDEIYMCINYTQRNIDSSTKITRMYFWLLFPGHTVPLAHASTRPQRRKHTDRRRRNVQMVS